MSEQNNRIEGKHQLQFHLRIDGISQFSIYSNLEIFYPKPENQPILTTRLQTHLYTNHNKFNEFNTRTLTPNTPLCL